MFVSKERNFIYLRVPKTGSTSMSNYLRDQLGANEGSIYTVINLLEMQGKNLPQGLEMLNPHSNTVQIVDAGIVDLAFVEQANIYACLRDPIERFLSRCYHIKHFDRNSRAQINDKNKLVEACLPMYTDTYHMWWPQITWCILNGKPVNKLFLYEDFDKAAQEMTGMQGAVNYHHRDDCHENDSTPLDNSLVQEIEKLYADDVALYKSLKG